MNLIAWPWTDVFQGTISGAETDAVKTRYTMPEINVFTTFRVVCTRFVGGSSIIKLRFGMDDADADACTLGIDFPGLALIDDSYYRSQVWDVAAAAPGTPGNPLSILPPRVSVQNTSVGGTDLDVLVQYACVQLCG